MNNFINLFEESRLLWAKALDYREFKKGIDLLKNKKHLTLNGLNQIKKKQTKQTKQNFRWHELKKN